MNSSEIATDTVAAPMKKCSFKNRLILGEGNIWNVPIFSCFGRPRLHCRCCGKLHADNEPSVLVPGPTQIRSPQQASPASRREAEGTREDRPACRSVFLRSTRDCIRRRMDAVVLRGFVFCQEDLLDALRIARSAAGR